MRNSEKEWHIHNLFDLLNNPKKFQLNWIRRKKYGQGHWKWYEQVKLYEQYHHMKSDVYHFYGVWVNPNVKVFNESTLDQRKTS